jgi:hypothetical protein
MEPYTLEDDSSVFCYPLQSLQTSHLQTTKIMNSSSFPAQNPHAFQTRQGQCLQYVMPQGWQVVEDGQYAVVLIAPDNSAVTIVVGNSGFPLYYNPAQYVQDTLMGQCQQFQMSRQPRQAQPIAGFHTASEFDYTYTVNGVPCRGIAKCSVANSYNMCTMVLTCAAAQTSQWANYASWLPQVASQVQVTNNAAFGMLGIMQQDGANDRAFAEKLGEYRNWSVNLWNQVTNHRNASHQYQNTPSSSSYTAQDAYGDAAFSNRTAYEDPNSQYGNHYYYGGQDRYVWTDGQGEFKSSDDPNYNPNIGSPKNWTEARKVRPA